MESRLILRRCDIERKVDDVKLRLGLGFTISGSESGRDGRDDSYSGLFTAAASSIYNLFPARRSAIAALALITIALLLTVAGSLALDLLLTALRHPNFLDRLSVHPRVYLIWVEA
jgi:hypothetical protein